MAFLARKTRGGFRLQEETYAPKRKIRTVPVEAYRQLGFSVSMTIEQAKARAKQLNAQKANEASRTVGAARRFVQSKKLNEAYLPAKQVAKFEDWLHSEYEMNEQRLPVIEKYWNTTKRLISELELDPKDFKFHYKKVLSYCIQRKWSHDYVKRIIRLMDKWGEFVARERGGHYSPIPKLKQDILQRIADSREGKRGIRTEALPLEWKLLKSKRSTFVDEGLEEQWNWMFIAAWFGLRPKECDNLKSAQNWKISYNSESRIEILEVKQTKILGGDASKKWKFIPVYFDEQIEALNLIRSGNFKRPLNKSLYRLLSDGIETYSPRKGFTDLMLKLDVTLEDISSFLGHASIDMTWKHYKNKRAFNLPAKPSKVRAA